MPTLSFGQRVFIKNRRGQNVAVVVDHPERLIGTAFVMHGLSGFKEQKHLEVIANAFVDHGYTCTLRRQQMVM